MQVRQQEAASVVLPEMSAEEFIPLAKAAEQRALAEPKEARKKRDLYLSKIDYASLDACALSMLTNPVITTTLLGVLSDENYISPHPIMKKELNIFLANLETRKAAIQSGGIKSKLVPQLRERIVITQASIDLFDKLYAILFNEKEAAKQKDAILKLEQQLLALKKMYETAKQNGLLAEPQVSKIMIDDLMTKGVDAIRPYLIDYQDEMSRFSAKLQYFKNRSYNVHDQLQLLITKMGNYPITLCTWFVKVFLAAKKGVNFEATCLAIKQEIETAQGKAVFTQLREALPPAMEVEKANTRSDDAPIPVESKKSPTSHALAMYTLAEHKEQKQKAGYDVKWQEEKEGSVHAESKAKAAAAAVPSKAGDRKDQKSVYSAGGSAMMKAPVNSGSVAVSSPLARSGAQVVARPAG